MDCISSQGELLTHTQTTKFNYRLATSSPKKRAGRRVFRETRHPIFRGVRMRNNNKWVCELREPNKKSRIWLGTYPTPEMAARAHDVAALALRGKSACLNFADSAWRLPVPASADADDIRKAAAEAAEAFRLSHDDEDQFEENGLLPEKNVFYMDEEAVFDMPGLLVNMAEGLLLSPPPLLIGCEYDDDDDDTKWNDYIWGH
ncbi:dehydration-responsive element-binding protein 1B [Citrus sinensis]|uniref:Dehydration-responsive element-binding protein 1B n=1 Tax=Citrus sinensis TaxID=2711 RepID=A0ACB8LXU0_CITSI|nr:dehydration-responsive element-binding protein 1B [Citrus sinensis]